jgi:hypothetical protein
MLLFFCSSVVILRTGMLSSIALVPLCMCPCLLATINFSLFLIAFGTEKIFRRWKAGWSS